MKPFFVCLFRILLTAGVTALFFYLATLFVGSLLNGLFALLGILAIIFGLRWSFKL